MYLDREEINSEIEINDIEPQNNSKKRMFNFLFRRNFNQNLEIKKSNVKFWLKLINIFSFIAGLIVLISAIQLIFAFSSSEKLANFISKNYIGTLKSDFTFSFIHLNSIFLGFFGLSIFLVYNCLIIFFIFINKAIKRFMWGYTLYYAIINIAITIASIVLLSILLSQISTVKFSNSDGKYVFKPAEWVAKAIGTVNISGSGGKINYSIWVCVIVLVYILLCIVQFVCSILAVTIGNILISPNKINQKRQKKYENKMSKIEIRKAKKITKLELRKIKNIEKGD